MRHIIYGDKQCFGTKLFPVVGPQALISIELQRALTVSLGALIRCADVPLYTETPRYKRKEQIGRMETFSQIGLSVFHFNGWLV